jgi:hypothetical protein
VSIARSKRAGKKYAAVVAGPGGRRRVVHFGAKGYEQFKDSTPLHAYANRDHGDRRRRERYFVRHSGVRNKQEAIRKELAASNGRLTPKLLSHRFLW